MFKKIIGQIIFSHNLLAINTILVFLGLASAAV